LLGGNIDALWQGAALPIPALNQITDTADAIVFGLSDDELTVMLKRFAFLSPAQIASDTYRGQTQAIKSVAAWNFVMAHQDFPQDDAYWITRTVLTVQDPSRLHASAAPTRMVNAPVNRVVPFHAGALRFYKERGIL
jgi:TRAP transporter TAXI family solute receptor